MIASDEKPFFSKIGMEQKVTDKKLRPKDRPLANDFVGVAVEAHLARRVYLGHPQSLAATDRAAANLLSCKGIRCAPPTVLFQ